MERGPGKAQWQPWHFPAGRCLFFCPGLGTVGQDTDPVEMGALPGGCGGRGLAPGSEQTGRPGWRHLDYSGHPFTRRPPFTAM